MSAYRRLNRSSRSLTFQNTCSYPINPNGIQINEQSEDSTAINWGLGRMYAIDDDLIQPSSLPSSMLISNGTDGHSALNHNNSQSIATSTATDDGNHCLSTYSPLSMQLLGAVNTSASSTTTTSSSSSYVPQPKHIRFPDVPYQSELLNELMVFSYTIISAAMQFLHLYRTVWWLPESNTEQSMVITTSIPTSKLLIHISSLNFPEFLFNRHTVDRFHCDSPVTPFRLLFYNETTGIAESAAFITIYTESDEVSGSERQVYHAQRTHQ